ncbi:MAG: hypothetical protein SGJ02_02440, partial [bacterium]|nr:hypothetical protein [bacterium]
IIFILFIFSIFIITAELSASPTCKHLKARMKSACSEVIPKPICEKRRIKFFKCDESRAVLTHINSLPAEGIICTQEYSPVCAELSSGAIRTFSNSCEATSFGAKLVSQNECDVACAALFDPICALTIFATTQTYPSRCEALSDGAKPIHNKDCVTS